MALGLCILTLYGPAPQADSIPVSHDTLPASVPWVIPSQEVEQYLSTPVARPAWTPDSDGLIQAPEPQGQIVPTLRANGTKRDMALDVKQGSNPVDPITLFLPARNTPAPNAGGERQAIPGQTQVTLRDFFKLYVNTIDAPMEAVGPAAHMPPPAIAASQPATANRRGQAHQGGREWSDRILGLYLDDGTLTQLVEVFSPTTGSTELMGFSIFGQGSFMLLRPAGSRDLHLLNLNDGSLIFSPQPNTSRQGTAQRHYQAQSQERHSPQQNLADNASSFALGNEELTVTRLLKDMLKTIFGDWYSTVIHPAFLGTLLTIALLTSLLSWLAKRAITQRRRQRLARRSVRRRMRRHAVPGKLPK